MARKGGVPQNHVLNAMPLPASRVFFGGSVVRSPEPPDVVSMASIALEGIVVAVAASGTPLQVNWAKKSRLPLCSSSDFLSEDIASRTERSPWS